MAYIGLSYNFSSVVGTVIGVVYAHANPSAEISDFRWEMDDTVDKPKVGKHVIDGVKPILYTIKFFQSSDGITLETDLQCDVAVNGAKQTSALLERYEYVVGADRAGYDPVTGGVIWRDPSPGDSVLIDGRLAGFGEGTAFVHLQGFGDYLNYQIGWQSGGGFAFTDGKLFEEDEKYVIWKKEIVETETPAAEVTSDLPCRPLVDADFTGGVINFTDALYNKWCPIDFTGQHCKIVFPSFALIPDCVVEFDTLQGGPVYTDLQFSSGNTVKFNGRAENDINLTRMEKIRLEFIGGVCRVRDYHGNITTRGQIIGDSVDRSSTDPYISVEETTEPLNGLVYTGLYKWLSRMPAGYAVSMDNWAANKRRWAIDTINKTLRPPLVLDMHRRFRSGSEAPGEYVADGNKEHSHFTIVDDVVNAGSSPVTALKTLVKNNEVNGNLSYRAQGKEAVANLSPTSKHGGTEVTVKAYKEIPLVVL